MIHRLQHDKLDIDARLYSLVINDILPRTGIDADHFWEAFQAILESFMPRNKALLATRDQLQQQIDDWHIQHAGSDFDPADYQQFLQEINYLLDEGDDFQIRTENVDPEIKTIAGPQLVVPINNARFALNATNARWGSLFDAFYGTDVIANEGELKKGDRHNPKRGKKVVQLANQFLDAVLPLTKASHNQVSAYTLVDCKTPTATVKKLQIILDNGHIAELKNTEAFVGYTEEGSCYSLLFKNNHLHIEVQIDPCSLIGKTMLAGVKDIILEAAITTIQDCEDSVTAVDAEDKVHVYKNWLGLMQGNLEDKFEKHGKPLVRQLNPDREYLSPKGQPLILSGRSLLLIRHVGHLMTTDAVKLAGENIPEGILDGMVTAAIFLHDYHGNSPYKNSPNNSMYIVKPKMHGPEEVRFTVDLFAKIEAALALPANTLKIGIMDEERRTTINLKACIRAAKDRLIFINTGFLDRTGDEIHTSIEAGAFLPKEEQKFQPWIKAYEDWNVDIGLACGLQGKAQIGKGMWAMPDLMADMVNTKIQHPLAGANCAWVPSPTAATLHAMHYHKVNVKHVQDELSRRTRASLNDILTIPLAPKSRTQYASEIGDCLDNNAQSILGYVVRWVNQGVGCSKVPDTHHIALMEDRATLRISSQMIANWLHHGLCSKQQVTQSFKKMAALVDEQNADDPHYQPMAPNFDGFAFNASLDLALKGRQQPNGYTEPLLHAYRIQFKASHS